MKTIGFTSVKLRRIQILQYLVPVTVGMVCGFLLAVPIGRIVSSATVTTIGVRIPVTLPFFWYVICGLAMPGVAVNGVDYTANVIDEPERFHILEGGTCMGDNEIVLTEFVADSFGVSIGDTVTVRGDSGSGEYIVSGIYSCANDMGDNVGMSREGYLKIGRDNPYVWCWHYFLSDDSQKSIITDALETAYGGDVHVHENTWPGLFGIISAMQALIVLMYGLVISFILIVTVMTGSLRFTFALRFGVISLIGSVIGVALSAALTDVLVSSVMKLAGISNFVSHTDAGNILIPGGVVVLLFFCFAYLAAGKIKSCPLREPAY